MSTEDVPGYKPENRDRLAMGCWAEHEDGSLIFVEAVEGGRAVYVIFDTSRRPVIQYRDAMAEGAFKKQFSWTPEKSRAKDDAWTWHDKTPFPWDRVIKEGARDGTSHADVEEFMTEAERVGESRRARRRRIEVEDEAFSDDNAAQRARRSREIHRGREVDAEELASRIDRLGEKTQGMMARLQAAIDRLKPGKGRPR
jgi:hypothetical protein